MQEHFIEDGTGNLHYCRVQELKDDEVPRCGINHVWRLNCDDIYNEEDKAYSDVYDVCCYVDTVRRKEN